MESQTPHATPAVPEGRGTHREPGEPGKLYRPDYYLQRWAQLWEEALERAVAEDMAKNGVTREVALRRYGDRIREEVERDTPATLRVARALRGDPP